MSGSPCAYCGSRDVGDARVCTECVYGDDSGRGGSLMRDLGDVHALSQALVGTYTRQSRTGSAGGSRSAERPLVWDERAREAADGLRNALTTWVRLLDMGDAPSSGNSRQLADWLLARLERVRHHLAGEEIIGDMSRAVDRARRAVDVPPSRIFAGPCDDCGHDLLAAVGKPIVRCDLCALEYDVAERRAWMLDAVQDEFGNAVMISKALTALHTEVTPERVRQWAARGRLISTFHDREGRPMYRVGDVMDLVVEAADSAARRTRRQAS